LLHGFVSDGFDAGDCIIVIATPSHLQALDRRLVASGFNLLELEAKKVYFPLEAELVLSKFMVNDWQDEALFNQAAERNTSRVHVIDSCSSGSRFDASNINFFLKTIMNRGCER
jgi:hypothetical protein